MSPPVRRPLVINLDAVGALLDRALAHPFANLVKMGAPDLHAAIVEAREDLTGVAAHLVGELHDRAVGAVDRKAAAAIRKVTGKKRRRKRLPR
jgi:hypothetical protein